MQGSDLAHHGQPQSGSPLAAARSVHLVKPLPYLLLLFLSDPDAIVPHSEQDILSFPAQRDPDVAALPAIPHGIIDQVLQQAADQRDIEAGFDLRLDIGLQGDILGKRGLLRANDLHQTAQIRLLKAGALRPLLQAGHL